VTATQPPPRSWLFVPGAAERFVAKLRGLSSHARPDAVIFDLEDGVATGDLSYARERVTALVTDPRAAPWLPPIIAVRTHAFTHPGFDEDLRALGGRVTTVLLPKVAAPAEVAAAAARLAAAGMPHVGIVAIIESAVGLEAVTEIAKSMPAAATSGPGLQGLAFGAEDFAADLGLPPRTGTDHTEPGGAAATGRLAVLDAARARIVTAAAGAGVPWRVDTPALRIGPGVQGRARGRNEARSGIAVGDRIRNGPGAGAGDGSEGWIEDEARRSHSMGFTGKFAIHPNHLQALHRGFEPAPAAVAWALAVVAAAAPEGGTGATLIDGQMVDEALLRQAHGILAARRGTTGAAGEGGDRDGGTDVG